MSEVLTAPDTTQSGRPAGARTDRAPMGAPSGRFTRHSALYSRGRRLFFILCLVLVGSILVSLRYGAHPLSWGDLGAVFGLSKTADTAPETLRTIVWNIRFPRVLSAMLIGGGLSVAGAAFQSLFRNPLVSPDILGASSGSAFGAALGIMFSLGVVSIQALSFALGLLAVTMACGLSRALGGGSFTLRLVLTGMVVGSLFMAGISMLKTLADPYSKLPLITFWLLGSLSSITKEDLPLLFAPLAVGCTTLLLLRWPLNVMALGEEEARALGLPTTKVRLLVLAAATLITSASVAIAGVIGWVGLMVPHLVRFAIGPNNASLLPCSLVGGALFLLWSDNLARLAFPVEMPLGVVTCACGIPVFLWVLKKSNDSWEGS